MNLITLLAALTLTFHGQEKTTLGTKGDNTCTAVLISSNKAITAGHCVEDILLVGKVNIVDSKENKYKAVILALDSEKDLTLIQLDHKYGAWARIGQLPHKGDKVYTYNSGEDLEGTYNEGIVCNIFKDPDSGINTLLTNVAILHGASGSGVFNYKGELVGIYTWVNGGLSGATSVLEIRKFLKSNNVNI